MSTTTHEIPDAAEVALEDIDVSDPALYESHAFPEFFRRLRREAPVHYCKDGYCDAFWSITKYDDVVEIEKNHEVFSSAFERGGISLMSAPERRDIVPGASFITMDPPEHGPHRAMVAPAFTAGNLKELESEIRARVTDILDPLPVGETFDWVQHVANELPIQMLATLFGVPQEDRSKLLRWSNLIIGVEDTDVVESREQAVEELKEFGEYFVWLMGERAKAEKGPDLISLLAHSAVGQSLSREDYMGNISLLVVGGNDTTRNSISGGLHGLMEAPDQYQKLRDDPSLIPSAVSEMIRWVAPVAHMRRTAVEDTVFRGHTIREGDKVAMWYLSANRDEDAFEAPDEFRVDRYVPGSGAPRHLSFGMGIHFCIGARLAEMQLRCLWEELLQRYPRISLEGEPTRLYSNFISGFKTMPVRIEA